MPPRTGVTGVSKLTRHGLFVNLSKALSYPEEDGFLHLP